MFFGDGRARVAPYRERMDLFTGGEVFPGVTTVPLPGHTPGHTGFMIASGNASLLIWGDIVHVQ
jgi:glyoxylase-like metal-dependent hydrolase (beta-lactamase superfamily II)